MPGETITYTVAVHNPGPSNVTGALVEDAQPVGLAGVSWTCAATGGATGTAQGTGDVSDRVDLPAGSTLVYTLHGILETYQEVTNTAVVAVPSEVNDPNPGSNSASVANRPLLLFLPVVRW